MISMALTVRALNFFSANNRTMFIIVNIIGMPTKMKSNKKYVSPEMRVVTVDTKDIMIFSVIFGNDSLDNWAEDPF